MFVLFQRVEGKRICPKTDASVPLGGQNQTCCGPGLWHHPKYRALSLGQWAVMGHYPGGASSETRSSSCLREEIYAQRTGHRAPDINEGEVEKQAWDKEGASGRAAWSACCWV